MAEGAQVDLDDSAAVQTFLAAPLTVENAQQFLAEFPLQRLTGFLALRNFADIDIVVKLLERVLNGPLGSALLVSSELRPLLAQGLQHPRADVRRLTVSQLVKTCDAQQSDGLEFLRSNDLLLPLVSSLADADVGVSETVNRFLVKVGSSGDGRSLLEGSGALERLRGLLEQGETARVRALQAFAGIAATSPDGFEWSRANSTLGSLASELDADDVLLRMNALQLVSQLCAKPDGVRLLEQGGVLKKCTEQVASSGGDGLYLGALLRCLSDAADRGGDPAVAALLRYPLLDALARYLADGEEAAVEGSLGALGGLASHRSGLRALAERPGLLRSLAESVASSRPAVRIAALHAAAAALASAAPDSPDAARLAAALGPDVGPLLVKYLRQPFPEIRNACFHLMQALLGRHQGAAASLLAQPAFFEWLLDRSTETTKEGKEWKFGAAQALHRASFGKELLGAKRAVELATHVRLGPFFKQTTAAVAVSDQHG
eukprot:tig00001249_g7773.t1